MKTVLIIVAVVVVVLVVFAAGIVKFESVQGWSRNIFYRGHGEVNKALQGEGVKNVEHAKMCRDNLHMLESAKRKVASDKGMAVGTITWPEVLQAAKLKEKPTCPDGGEYRLNDLGRVVTCTISGNDTMDKADDHTIFGY